MKIELNRTATVLSCICPICEQPGTIRTIEVLPDNGLSMECIHHDEQNSSHKWAEFDSMDVVVAKSKGKEPKIIVCPVCNKKGRVNGYHPHGAAPQTVEYLVTHEKLKGTWGRKGNKISRRRRCYIKKPKDREAILKKLGRYIQPTNNLERYIEK